MAIVYPLATPSLDAVSVVVPRPHVAAALVTSPFTGSDQVYEWPGEYWVARVTLGDLPRTEVQRWHGWVAALRGPVGTFLIGDPSVTGPLGAGGGTPVVDGSGQTGRVLATRGWPNGVAGVLVAGDMIQIGNRLHMVTADAASDGGGDAALDIWPRLRESPDDGAAVVTAAPKGLFRLVPPYPDLPRSPGPLYGLSFECKEAL